MRHDAAVVIVNEPRLVWGEQSSAESSRGRQPYVPWIPAFAGMTSEKNIDIN